MATPPAELTECSLHPRPKWRECHHLEDRFVAVYWDVGFDAWVLTTGSIGKRGAIFTLDTDEERSYMLDYMRREVMGA